MANRKVDPVKMEALLRSGLSISEVARRLGVHKSNVSRQAAALEYKSSANVMLYAAEKVATKKINAMAKLEKIMGLVEEELEFIRGALKKSEGSERRAWQEALIAHSAEIRKQLGLLREIFQTMYSIEQVEKFKETVLSVIAKVDENVREQILKELGEQRRAARGVLAGSGAGV